MRLGNFILENIERILEAWAQSVRSLDGGAAMDNAAVRDEARQVMESIAKDLESAPSAADAGRKPLGRMASENQGDGLAAMRHGERRFGSGFDIEVFVAGYQALRASILHLRRSALAGVDMTVEAEDTARFNQAIDQSLAEAVAGYASRKEQEIRHFSTILASSPDHHCAIGLDGRFVYVNKSMADAFELQPKELIGKNLFELSVASASTLHVQIKKVIETKKPFSAEIASQSDPENPNYFEYSLVPIFNDSGEVEAVAGTARNVTARKLSEDQIWRKANYDLLTGLPNRRLFRDRLEQEIKQAERTGDPLALLFIDLDRFKDANDMFGHDAGDLLLRQAAERIRACIRVRDTVARLGGDEFTVILADIGTADQVEHVTNKILRELAQPFIVRDEMIHISASIGITLFPDDAQSSDRLVRNADRAMYVAKNAGRNQFCFFTQNLHEAAQVRYRLIADLRQSLAKEELAVYYQPIVELADGTIHKAEALLRWLHPEHGMIMPVDFIPLAEEAGLITEISEWVFMEVARQSKEWEEFFGTPFQISVNKSPIEFMTSAAGAINWVAHLKEIGLHGSSISFEITEGILLNSSIDVARKLKALHDGGIKLAVDDFGTGYSSLSYLNKFDLDYIKIDQSFVHDMPTDLRSRTIAETIIVMAHKLGLQVIAEGVETESQRIWLRDCGCDYAQGFLFAQAVPAARLQSMLEAARTLN